MAPTGPSSPHGPGVVCTFKHINGAGPDPTTPSTNARLVSQDSISLYIQCAGEDSRLQLTDETERRVNALDILVSATEMYGQYTLSQVIQNYASSRTDQRGSLTHYLCGKASNSDLCALGTRMGVRKREHSLAGVCTKTYVNILDYPDPCHTDIIDAGDDDSSTTADDTTGNTINASSPTTVTDASGSTATALMSQSSDPATTTSQAQTTSITADASSTPTPTSNAASRMLTAGSGELTTAGVLLIVLVAGL